MNSRLKSHVELEDQCIIARDNRHLMIAYQIEGRGKRTLTIVGPDDISIASLISLVSVDAAASVCCLVSSMTWAYRCWLERNTANRGLSVVPFSCTPQKPTCCLEN